MGELEDLKREEARLLNLQELRNENSTRQTEKQKVKKRIWVLKHPKIVKVVNVGKRSIVGVGIIAGAGFNKARPYLEQGANNFMQNSQSPVLNPFEQRSQKRKRVVKVRKRKRR
jgi:tRNA A22 N-methylase